MICQALVKREQNGQETYKNIISLISNRGNKNENHSGKPGLFQNDKN